MEEAEIAGSEGSVPLPASSGAARVRWMVALRFAMLPVAVALVASARALTGLPFSLAMVAALSGAVMLYNGTFWLLLRRWRAAEPPDGLLRFMSSLGGLFDFAVLTVLVHFTGGTVSPWFYYPATPPLISAVILPGRNAVWLVLFGIGGLLALFAAEVAGVLPSPIPAPAVTALYGSPGFVATQAIGIAVFLGALAYALAYLSERERRTESAMRIVAEDRQALLELTRELSLSLEPAELVDLLVRRGRELVGCDRVCVTVLREPDGTEAPGAVPDCGEIDQGMAGLSAAVIEQLFERPAVQLPSSDLSELNRLVRPGHVLLVVPFERARLRGCVIFSSSSEQYFDARRLALAEGIARHAAIAVENAHSFAAARESSRVTSALLDISRRIGGTLEVEQLVESLAEATRDSLGAQWVIVYLWNPMRQLFVPSAFNGVADSVVEAMQDRELEVDGDAFLESMRDGGAEELGVWSRRGPLSQALPPAAAGELVLAGGMRAASAPLGFVAAGLGQGRRRAREAELALLKGILQQAGATLENAQLHGAVQVANRLKSQFVATMSHELRTPLNAIIGYGELLIEGAFGELVEEQRDVLAASQRKASQLLDLIAGTLDLNRLESGRDPVECSIFSLSTMCAEIAVEIEGTYGGASVAVGWQVLPSFPALCTDRRKLKLLLKNLVSNAVKFTREGTVTIDAALQPDRDGIVLRVVDTGVGIAVDDLGVIFDMFQQGRGENGRHQGVGLGLHIAKRLVDALGGSIDVESTVGVGSVFVVRLSGVVADEQRAAV